MRRFLAIIGLRESAYHPKLAAQLRRARRLAVAAVLLSIGLCTFLISPPLLGAVAGLGIAIVVLVLLCAVYRTRSQHNDRVDVVDVGMAALIEQQQDFYAQHGRYSASSSFDLEGPMRDRVRYEIPEISADCRSVRLEVNCGEIRRLHVLTPATLFKGVRPKPRPV
jgi:hypothetical protein